MKPMSEMTNLEWYAGQALAGLLAHPTRAEGLSAEDVVKVALEYAQWMVVAAKPIVESALLEV